MGARIADSALYGHLWGTDELRAVFDERARLQSWLDILVALAQVQAELGIVPTDAVEVIARRSKVERLDLGFVAEETRRTGHSTLGLIHGLRRVLPEEAREWVYHGITVQDVSDTWT
ncbi:MAG: class-II fumarase/aspartase family protein, partial [Actinomycetota bacterium]